MMESLGRILTRLLKSVLDLPPAVAPAAQKAIENGPWEPRNSFRGGNGPTPPSS